MQKKKKNEVSYQKSLRMLRAHLEKATNPVTLALVTTYCIFKILMTD
jgi:hypothetical protein